MSTVEIILKGVIMFFVLVTIHEWGHFYFAKRAGILVREFAIGFGPKLFTFKKGETRYTLRLLPIGGFVRMAGEDPELVTIQPGQTIAIGTNAGGQVSHLYLDRLDSRSNVVQGIVESLDLERQLQVKLQVGDELAVYDVHPQAMMVAKGTEVQIAPWNRQFGSKRVSQRALSIVMGPVMNFLLAIVLFAVFVVMLGVPTNVKLDKVEPATAGQKAGLQAGDIVISVNDVPIEDQSTRLQDLIRQSPGKPMNWVIQRDSDRVKLTVTPDTVAGQGKVGVRIGADTRRATVSETLKSTWEYTSASTVAILDGFRKLVFGQVKIDDLGGPLRIAEVTAQYARSGMTALIYWSASLSLYLGLFNLLPFPALDGSRLVFLGFEAIRGKPVDPSRESIVHFVGFALLMMLMVAVTYHDILRLING